MQHRGEIIKDAVYKSGYPITELAKRIGKSRRWVYLLFENATVSIDIMLQIGKIIHYDFTEDLHTFGKNLYLRSEPPNPYITDEDYWKNKYLKLLEEYNDLLKKK
jgi:predicted transcriptional regulator